MRVHPIALILMFFTVQSVCAETLEVHIDADYSISEDAAQAIELGIRTALSEVDGTIAGYPIEIIANDHRGNVKRSRRTMENYLENDAALVIFGGLHSPPYLTNQDFINQNGILTLLPWSAAGAITRPVSGADNWIFRLSVDDLKTAPFLVDEAIERSGCHNTGLILVDTGWGRGNFTSLSAAFEARGSAPIFSQFFSPTISHLNARILAQDFASSGADCAIILANWDNGAEVILALHDRLPDVRVFSHWGIMGGAFAQIVSHDVRSDLELRVLQTCGLRIEADGSENLSAALRSANENFDTLADVPAATGFVHGYDLTRVLISAVTLASTTQEWAGDIVSKRQAVRNALENPELEVQGILKTYSPPFEPYTSENSDAHEALGLADLCMATFSADGDLTLSR